MTRHFSTLSVYILAIALGSVLFLTSQKVQLAERDLQNLRDQITAEEETLKITRAEWAYLNRPDRLEALASTYLNLAPAQTKNIYVAIKDVPLPRVDQDDITSRVTKVADTPTPIKTADKKDKTMAVASIAAAAPDKAAAMTAAQGAPASGTPSPISSFDQMMTRITSKDKAP